MPHYHIQAYYWGKASLTSSGVGLDFQPLSVAHQLIFVFVVRFGRNYPYFSHLSSDVIQIDYL
jgi:hypothetical protein